jgi:hypothetical protein
MTDPIATDYFDGGSVWFPQPLQGRLSIFRNLEGPLSIVVSDNSHSSTYLDHETLLFLDLGNILDPANVAKPLAAFTTERPANASVEVKQWYTPTKMYNPDNYLNNFFIIRPYWNPFFTPWLTLQVGPFIEGGTSMVAYNPPSLVAELRGRAFIMTQAASSGSEDRPPQGFYLPYRIRLEFRGTGNPTPIPETGHNLPADYHYTIEAARAWTADVTMKTWITDSGWERPDVIIRTALPRGLIQGGIRKFYPGRL